MPTICILFLTAYIFLVAAILRTNHVAHRAGRIPELDD
jgi:hypothetical protein